MKRIITFFLAVILLFSMFTLSGCHKPVIITKDDRANLNSIAIELADKYSYTYQNAALTASRVNIINGDEVIYFYTYNNDYNMGLIYVDYNATDFKMMEFYVELVNAITDYNVTKELLYDLKNEAPQAEHRISDHYLDFWEMTESISCKSLSKYEKYEYGYNYEYSYLKYVDAASLKKYEK